MDPVGKARVSLCDTTPPRNGCWIVPLLEICMDPDELPDDGLDPGVEHEAVAAGLAVRFDRIAVQTPLPMQSEMPN